MKTKDIAYEFMRRGFIVRLDGETDKGIDRLNDKELIV